MKRNIIPVSALVTLGTITLSNVQDGKGLFTTREIVGYLILFTMISAGNDLGLDFAGGFALLVMIAVLLARGERAFKFVTGKTEEKTKTKGTKENTPIQPIKRPGEPTLS